jgi:asparagine synthase (glutamine-hydrolysing)
MFILIAGRNSAERDGLLETLASKLRGGTGSPRQWRDPERHAAAAASVFGVLPEDVFDAQPIVGEARVFVCQARLDNRDDLMRDLGLSAGADSAVLFSAYARWGERCLQKLSGDFAFVVWHRREGRVVAAVDPLGERRLLWARSGNALIVSAQLPPILAHPDVSQSPDLLALARLFDVGIDRQSTPFASVRALPGGHMLEWRGGDVRVDRWWSPETNPSVWYRDPNDYIDDARELFSRAVAATLRSRVPISSTLSGGLDSGLVTTTAARQLAANRQSITAYTAVPSPGLTPSERQDWETDDRGYASEVVAATGNIDHRLVSPDGQCTLDVVSQIHDRSLTPTKSATNLLWLGAISSSAARAGSRVLLMGQAGNTALSWRGIGAIYELAMRGRWPTMLVCARLEAADTHRSLARVLASAAKAGLQSVFGKNAIEVASIKFVRAERRPAIADRRGMFAERPGSRQQWVAFATTPKHVWWPDPIVQWNVEWRDPTANRWLIERLLKFPAYAFRSGGRDRGLARTLAAGLLPDRVRLRRTQGAQVPEAPSLIAANSSRYYATLELMKTSPACRELFDFDSLKESLDAICGGSLDYYLSLAVDRAFDVGLFLYSLERRS